MIYTRAKIVKKNNHELLFSKGEHQKCRILLKFAILKLLFQLQVTIDSFNPEELPTLSPKYKLSD